MGGRGDPSQFKHSSNYFNNHTRYQLAPEDGNQNRPVQYAQPDHDFKNTGYLNSARGVPPMYEQYDNFAA